MTGHKKGAQWHPQPTLKSTHRYKPDFPVLELVHVTRVCFLLSFRWSKSSDDGLRVLRLSGFNYLFPKYLAFESQAPILPKELSGLSDQYTSLEFVSLLAGVGHAGQTKKLKFPLLLLTRCARPNMGVNCSICVHLSH